MNLPNCKPLPPELPDDWVDPDLVKAFGIAKDEEQEAFGPLKKRTVLEIYPQSTGPVKTPFEQP